MAMTERQRQRYILQRRASRRMGSLMHEFGARCFYCKREVAPISHTRKRYRIVCIKKQWFTWAWTDGTTHTALIATIDHVVPLSQGGDNKKGNLVLCCIGCNGRRNDLAQGKKLTKAALKMIGESAE